METEMHNLKPRGMRWSQFSAGQIFLTEGRTIESGDVSLFAGLSGDFNPLHISETFAQKTPFKGRVAHGLLTLSISTGQQNQLGIFEGTTLAYLGMDEVKFLAPVRFGDTVRTILAVSGSRVSSKSDRGVVEFNITVKNQNETDVLTYRQSVLMAGDAN
jgi:3-hydroxybutyryl-CoA dehydratase